MIAISAALLWFVAQDPQSCVAPSAPHQSMLCEYRHNKHHFHHSSTDHRRVVKGSASCQHPRNLVHSTLTIQPFALEPVPLPRLPQASGRLTPSFSLFGSCQWNGVKSVMVSAKQLGWRCLAFVTLPRRAGVTCSQVQVVGEAGLNDADDAAVEGAGLQLEEIFFRIG